MPALIFKIGQDLAGRDTTASFRFLRRPKRPLAKSGSAAGSGVIPSIAVLELKARRSANSNAISSGAKDNGLEGQSTDDQKSNDQARAFSGALYVGFAAGTLLKICKLSALVQEKSPVPFVFGRTNPNYSSSMERCFFIASGIKRAE
jgi:hypothetical protein